MLGPDSDWENPDAMADPAKSVGLSPSATVLRIATEDLERIVCPSPRHPLCFNEMVGPRYAVICSAVGVSDGNGIVRPEPGTLEARLTALPGPGLFIATHKGQGLPASEITRFRPAPAA